MVPEVVHDSLDRPAVEEVAVSVRELGLQDPAHAPASDSVGEGEGEYTNDGGQYESKQRAVKNVAKEQGGQRKVTEGKIERRCEVVAHDAPWRLACADG